LYMGWVHALPGKQVTSFDEINVQRLNIIEPDGKPRVIISNRARMAGLYWGGKEYQHRTRDEGGFLFFNDDGDEVGGMNFSNRRQGDDYSAHSALKFDQHKQQETLELSYGESNGRRGAGLRIYDQPDESIFPAIELSDKLRKAGTEEDRRLLTAQMQELNKKLQAAGGFTNRLFAGKDGGSSLVMLADKKGRPRLMLKVDAEGAASIEFLDEAGKVVHRMPQG
ncbi:MAG: hypothetical protein ACREXP_12620, partial [Steroidobacteraceae bacterium]